MVFIFVTVYALIICRRRFRVGENTDEIAYLIGLSFLSTCYLTIMYNPRERITELLRSSQTVHSLVELADLYSSLGHIDYSIRHLNQALPQCSVDKQWVLHIKLAKLHRDLDEETSMLGHLTTAHSLFPTRPEAMFLLASYWKDKRLNLCIPWVDSLLSIKLTPDEKYEGKIDHVHTYGVHELALIVLYYIGKPSNAGSHITQLLSSAPHLNARCGLRNYRFYCRPIQPLKTIDLSGYMPSNVEGLDLHSSTPSIVKHEDGYLVNVRYINYNLPEHGQFVCPEIGYVYNANKAIMLDSDLSVIYEPFTHHPDPSETTYDRGLQDVRLWATSQGNVSFTATASHHNNVACVSHGLYSPDGLSSASRLGVVPLSDMSAEPITTACEKNWVHISDSLLIHSWSPIRIGSINNDAFVTLKTIDTPLPGYFAHMRGGSHATTLPEGDLLFVTHIVGYCDPRIYFHCFVVLDKETSRVKSYSYPFKLTQSNVEYCAGAVVEGNSLLLAYSENDGSSLISVFDLNYIRTLLVHVKDI